VNRWRERCKAGLFAFPLAVLITFLWAGPASAHTELVKTVPADGTQITAAPDAVSLTFSGQVLKLGAAVKVSGPGGSAAIGAAKVKGKTVSWPVSGDLANGTYSVSWRVTAADGHPIDGKFEFVLQAPAATTSPAVALDPTPTFHTAEPQMTGPMDGMEGMPGMGAQRPTTESTESTRTTGFAIAGLLLLTAMVTGAIVIERRRRPRPAAGPPGPPTD
jgi:methionine-rich copper-binding protein CopC